MSKVLVNFIGNAKGLNRPIAQAKGALTKFGKHSDGVASNISASFKKIGVGLAAAGTAVSAFGAAAVKDFAAADDQIREVGTLLGDVGSEQLGELHSNVRAIAEAYGQGGEEVATAFYDSISAGVANSDTVSVFVEEAAKFATAGATEMGPAVDILTSAINAFGYTADDAGLVSDIFFSTVKAGKTTVDELGRAFAQVGPLAGSMGLSLEEVMAWIAQLTLSGTSTQVATNQVKAALANLSRPTRKLAKEFKEVSGVSFQEYIEQGGTLQEVTELIAQRAEDTGRPMIQLSTSMEDVNALLGVTGENAAGFSDTLNSMSGAAGVTEIAFGTMSESAGFQLRQITESFTSIKITVGQALMPVLQRFADWFSANKEGIVSALTAITTNGVAILASAFETLSGWVEGISSLFGSFKGWLEGLGLPLGGVGEGLKNAEFWGRLLAGALALIVAVKIVGFVTTFMGALKLLVPVLKGVKLSVATLNAVLIANPIVAVIAAVAALSAGLVILYQNNETFRNAVQRVFEFIKDHWKPLLLGVATVITGPFGAAVLAIVLYWDEVWAFLKSMLSWVKDTFWAGWEFLWNGIKKFGGWLITGYVAYFRFIWDLMKEMASWLIETFAVVWESLRAGLSLAWAGIEFILEEMKEMFRRFVGWIKMNVVDRLIGYFNTIPAALAAAGRSAVNGMIDIINKGGKLINDLVPDKINIPFAPDIDLPDNPIPTIPRLAQGGIVTRPTLALIGEAGPEAVVPLSKSGGAAYMGGTVTIHIHGDVYGDDQALADKVVEALDERVRISGPLYLEVAS